MDARRPARDRVQAICSAIGTRCRTGSLAFVMARTRRYSIEIRNSNGEAVFVTVADWDEEGRRAAAALILRIDGRLESGNAVDLGRGFRQSQGRDSPSSLADQAGRMSRLLTAWAPFCPLIGYAELHRVTSFHFH